MRASRRVIALLVPGALAFGLAVTVRRWPAINDVETGSTPEYPDLQPKSMPLSLDQTLAAAVRAARGMRGWRNFREDARRRVLEVEADVWLTPFIDDVTIRIDPAPGGSVVRVRSRSRLGKGDLGTDARRIRAYLRRLDEELRHSGRT